MSPRLDKGKGVADDSGKKKHQRPRLVVCQSPQLATCPPPQSQVNRMSMASTQGFLPLLSSQYPYDNPSFITPPPPGYPSFQQTQMPPSSQQTQMPPSSQQIQMPPYFQETQMPPS